jgi:hypothetical protein
MTSNVPSKKTSVQNPGFQKPSAGSRYKPKKKNSHRTSKTASRFVKKPKKVLKQWFG